MKLAAGQDIESLKKTLRHLTKFSDDLISVIGQDNENLRAELRKAHSFMAELVGRLKDKLDAGVLNELETLLKQLREAVK